ncbi:MAG: UDP-glucose--hexose-1-phosphate uridylyltransferase [Vallitaleaceae bacterium]|nr:UDP-glucose--hexose-1-phosphate uridylyltransferase [Vallitaleaceae bacterium]
MTEKSAQNIEKLLLFGLKHKMLQIWDLPQIRNQLLDLLCLVAPYEGESLKSSNDTLTELLKELLDEAAARGLIKDNVTERDLLDAKIMAQLLPRQSEVIREFYQIQEAQGKEAATDYFYALSQNSNYIRMDRIAKNRHWMTQTEFGNFEITINLSKPEKDPAEIAAERNTPQLNYPKCLLCLENVGYAGRLNHPGRSNHRVIPITLDEQQWYIQYSPYVYYNEHAIIFSEAHRPMTISKKSFKRLLDFVDLFPHYFIGSNADLPIVGGSILSHDHFQGGHHTFPMEVAKVLKHYVNPNYEGIDIQMIKWPLSVIRLESTNQDSLIELANHILELWRNYSDEDADILAFSAEVPHNTITPIARKNRAGRFELDLTLRNNRTTTEHPGGIFHPHEHLHHIKKENIGLIEVMGLAVLPPRLKDEMTLIEKILTGDVSFEEAMLDDTLIKHELWAKMLVENYGTNCSPAKATEAIQEAVGLKFSQVLECSGVYKQTEQGLASFEKFIQLCTTIK